MIYFISQISVCILLKNIISSKKKSNILDSQVEVLLLDKKCTKREGDSVFNGGGEPLKNFFYDEFYFGLGERMREDSNPRYFFSMPVFKTGTLNHSDTHPTPLCSFFFVEKRQKLLFFKCKKAKRRSLHW